MSESEWKWFPRVKTDWSLDVVNLLVVIGESAMVEHAQPITSSLLCVLPRIIPAPQIFLKPTRPTRLPEVQAFMTGVHSGTTLTTVGYFANIITPLDDLKPQSFQVLNICHSNRGVDKDAVRPAKTFGNSVKRSIMADFKSWRRTDAAGPSSSGKRRRVDVEAAQAAAEAEAEEDGSQDDPEAATAAATTSSRVNGRGDSTVQRRKTKKQKVQDLLALPRRENDSDRPAIPPQLFSPLHMLGVLSFFVTIAILVCAVIWEDANAILAIGLISIMSSLSGFASFWSPQLMTRRQTNVVPPGDVMIRTRQGAFVLIRCTEDVARELYSGTDRCKYYVKDQAYRLLMALGTVLLMLSVVLLGNCSWNSQVFIGASYIVLNGLYWGLGMLPHKYFWDLDRYDYGDATPRDAEEAHFDDDNGRDPEFVRGTPPGVPADDYAAEKRASFTRTLWYAIRETKDVKWVKANGAAPPTKAWDTWLTEAEQNARAGNRDWPAVKRKNELMKEHHDEIHQTDASTALGGTPSAVSSFTPAQTLTPATTF